MQIISDFHDYYDIGMQNGIDPQLPYRRFRREEVVEFPLDGDRWSFGWRIQGFDPKHWEYHFFYLGFAGKVWSCLECFDNPIERNFCFDPTLIDDSYFIEISKQYGRTWNGRKPTREKDVQRSTKAMKELVFECFEFKNAPELLNLFEQFKTAIFVYKLGSKTIIIDERLNLYHFQKVLPPMEAFQELAMYVGDRLTKPVIEEPPISDKIKAEIYGFDKHSFRKGKTKK